MDYKVLKLNIMKRILVLSSLMVGFCSGLFAQYSAPNSIAYDQSTKNYFISNTGNGTVTKLDANYKTSTVITGLTKPKGLFFVDLGSNKFLIVLDGNKAKLYDPSTYGLFQTITVTGATELEDAVINPNNPKVFYMSDRTGNKIIRGEVGPAPFYFPSFSDLSTGISKPSGLWTDSKGRLLMVQDTLNSPITQVDTSTGKRTILKSTTIDYMNSIIQDREGNYFVNNWGDDYLYRFTPDFSDSVKLSSFNNPAGFYFNEPFDMLVMACSGCGKLDFFKLHNFIPNGAVSGCPGDSATVLMNGAYKSIGTFGSRNEFMVEASDDQGDFNPPIIVGRIASTTNPSSIRVKIPSSNYGNGNLKYRIRSTSPPHYSTEYDMYVNPLPDAFAYEYDKAGICLNASIRLGGPPRKDYLYSWKHSASLDDTTLSAPVYTGNAAGTELLILKVTDTKYGCIAYDSVEVNTQPSLTLPQLKDTVALCQGDSTAIGVTNSDFSFVWTPNQLLNNDSISNPVTSTTADLTYQVSFSDTNGCTGADSVRIKVDPTPLAPDINNQWYACANETVTMTGDPVSGDNYAWTPSARLSTDTGLSVTFIPDDSVGMFKYSIIATNAYGCSSERQVTVEIHPLPKAQLSAVLGQSDTSVVFELNDTTGVIKADLFLVDGSSSYILFDTSLSEGTHTYNFSEFPQSVFGTSGQKIEFDYYALSTNDHGCESYSDTMTFTWLSLPKIALLDFGISPNPASDIIQLELGDIQTPVIIGITNSAGQQLRFPEPGKFTDSSVKIDLTDLPAGVYTIEVTTLDGRSGTKKIVLH